MNKKVGGILLGIVLILSAILGIRQSQSFNPEKILKNSLLKERSFTGQTVEIAAGEQKIKAYLMEEHSVPLVALAFSFKKAGQAYETKEGVALLSENAVLDGAGDYSRQELREIMKEKGIHLSVSAGRDELNYALSYVKEFEEDAIKVLKAVLYEPHLQIDDLNLTRQQLAAVRKQQFENPQYYLSKLVDENFYGTHPYGKENIPAEDVLNAISADDIRNYLEKRRGKDNLVIGISGDISANRAEALLDEIFSSLPDKAEVVDLGEFEPNFNQEKVEDEVSFSSQSFVLLASHGIKRLDKDFYPLYIADYILGGSGLNSRLNKAIREEKGLTYGIYSYFSNSDAIDLWQVAFSASPENMDKALEVAAEEYQRFYDEGVSKEELERAKKSLLSSFNLRFASLFHIAEMLKIMQLQELGIDFLNKRQAMVAAVSLDDVNTAIKNRMPKKLSYPYGVRIFLINGAKK